MERVVVVVVAGVKNPGRVDPQLTLAQLDIAVKKISHILNETTSVCHSDLFSVAH
jgi:hypothetical protein